MTKNEKRLLALSAVLSAALCVPTAASAMHIMEGYLPPVHCIVWAAVCIPFLVSGLLAIRRTLHAERRTLILLAMSGAFIFVISSLKIPSVSGSCSHMTGTGLSAILFWPCHHQYPWHHRPAVSGNFACTWRFNLFGCQYLQHGGCRSPAELGHLEAQPQNGSEQKDFVFFAAFLGDLFTYCVTGIQLALANPSAQGGIAASAVKFLGVFAPTQLPLAIIEGILTMLIVMGLETYAKPELRLIGFFREERVS